MMARLSKTPNLHSLRRPRPKSPLLDVLLRPTLPTYPTSQRHRLTFGSLSWMLKDASYSPSIRPPGSIGFWRSHFRLASREPETIVGQWCSLLDITWDKSMLRHLGDTRGAQRTVAIYVLTLPNNPPVKPGFRWFTKEALANPKANRDVHYEPLGEKCKMFLFGAEKWHPGHQRWGPKPRPEPNTSVLNMSAGKRPPPPSVSEDKSPPIALGAHKYAPNHRVQGTVTKGPNRKMVVELANAREKDKPLTARLANPTGTRRFKPGDTVECRVIRAFATSKNGKRHSAFIAAVDVESMGVAEEVNDGSNHEANLAEAREAIAAYYKDKHVHRLTSPVPEGSCLIATRGPKCPVSLGDLFSTDVHLDSLADVHCLGEDVFDGVKNNLSDMGATFVAADHVKLRGIAGDGSASLIGVVLHFPFRFTKDMGMMRENLLVIRMHYSMILGASFMRRYVDNQKWSQEHCTMWDTPAPPNTRTSEDQPTHKVPYSTHQWDIKLGKHATCGVVRICASSMEGKGKKALAPGDESSSEDDALRDSDVNADANASRRPNGKDPMPMPSSPPQEVKAEPHELPPGPSIPGPILPSPPQDVKPEPRELPPGPSNPDTMESHELPPGPSNMAPMGADDNKALKVKAFYAKVRATYTERLRYMERDLRTANAQIAAHNLRDVAGAVHETHDYSVYASQLRTLDGLRDSSRVEAEEYWHHRYLAGECIYESRAMMRGSRSTDPVLHEMATRSWNEACEEHRIADEEFRRAHRAFIMYDRRMSANRNHIERLRLGEELRIIRARIATLPSEDSVVPPSPPIHGCMTTSSTTCLPRLFGAPVE